MRESILLFSFLFLDMIANFFGSLSWLPLLPIELQKQSCTRGPISAVHNVAAPFCVEFVSGMLAVSIKVAARLSLDAARSREHRKANAATVKASSNTSSASYRPKRVAGID